MKRSLIGALAFGLSMLLQATFAQGTLTYEGPYLQGEATYQYTEDAKQQRVFNGPFAYTEVRNMPQRGGEQEILATGNYKNDKKHLAWAVTVKSTSKDSGLTETIIGNYAEGEKSGLWTHRIRRNSDDSEMRYGQASFIKNHFRGPFKMNYENESGVPYIGMEVTGKFNEAGLIDGAWKLRYADQDSVVFEDELRFKNGVLAYRSLKNVNSGEVLESYDDESRVNAFFNGMDRVDSFAVVDDQKLGLRKKKFEHEIIVPIIDAWTDMGKLDLGLNYNATVPMMIIRQGELNAHDRLMIAAELIDWAETPKGKAEIEAAKELQKAYDQKINVADLQFNQSNYRQAIPLYEAALKIKKDEAYPKQQIAIAQEEIRKEEEKMRLITVVSGRHTLWKGNDKMLTAEGYYGDKDKLYEAAIIALDYQKKKLNKNYGELLAYIDRKAYDNITLSALETLQGALDDLIAFQDQLKALSKQGDKDDNIKEMEKELKKMEDPNAIINRIKQG